MQAKINSVIRLTDKETDEITNMVAIYTNSKDIDSLRMYKNGLTEIKGNNFKVYDSYLESVVYDTINTTKEGRVYNDLLGATVDKDSVINLLLCGAEVELEIEKVDSENENNTLGYYFKYNIQSIKLNLDELAKASLFELYQQTFSNKSEAYLRFVAKCLGVDSIFFA